MMLSNDLTGRNAVGFIRVSTSEQGNSKLGLQAQEQAVREFCDKEGLNLVGMVTEVISGTLKINERKELQKALKLAKKNDAFLVAQKLDRISRSVSQISKLLDEGVPFISCELGAKVDRFFVHIMSAVAEQEARRISDRTRAALAAKKAQGFKLGSPDIKKAQKAARVANKSKANDFALGLKALIDSLDKAGISSYRQKAIHLNSIKVKTRQGNEWTTSGMRSLCLRLESL